MAFWTSTAVEYPDGYSIGHTVLQRTGNLAADVLQQQRPDNAEGTIWHHAGFDCPKAPGRKI